MGYLKEIVFCFDKNHKLFTDNFFRLLNNVTETNNLNTFLKISNNLYLPRVIINKTSSEKGINVNFKSDDYITTIQVKNETQIHKKNNEKYSSIELNEISNRFDNNNISITKIDHIGFNLPWFSDGIHPKIKILRKNISQKCLYHKFPGGEPWDFIIPGLKEEIDCSNIIDYKLIRKPKIEIVSFDKCSKPIIQFDVCCSCKKELFPELFPEGLYDSNLGNVWVYIQNPFNIDFCLVLNENSEGDWSNYFEGNRIII